MAITRAQQARQLYKNGKRVGFFSAGLAAGDDISPGTNTSGESRDDRTRERSDPESLALAFGNKNKKGLEQIVGGLSDKQKKIRQIISEQRKKAKGELKPSTTTKNRVISGLLGFLNPFGIPFSGSLYNRAIDSTAMGYGKSKGPTTVERGGDDFTDIMADNNPVYDEEFTPYEGGEIAKLIAERDKNEAYRFMADGGRAAFQEGGGIFPRIDKLGNKVSSAEQELAAINSRLDTAQSSLGGQGGQNNGGGVMNNSILPDSPFPDVAEPAEVSPFPGIEPVSNEGIDGQTDSSYNQNFNNIFTAPSPGGEGILEPNIGSNNPAGPMPPAMEEVPYSIVQPATPPPQAKIPTPGELQPLPGFDNRRPMPFELQGPGTGNAPQMAQLFNSQIDGTNSIPRPGGDQLLNAGTQPGIIGGRPGSTIPMPELRPGQNSGQISPLQTAISGGGLANLYRGGFAEGGMPEYEGGIMDIETGRQQYFLGKLVKKAKRAIGKVTKSKAGKAALLAGLGSYGFGIGPFRDAGYGSGFLKNAFTNEGIAKRGFDFLKEGYDDMDGKDKFSLLAAAGLTAAPLLFQDDEEDPDFTSNRGPGLNIEELRKNPYATMGGAYRFYADGGRIGYNSGSGKDFSKSKVYQKWVQRYESNPDSPLVTMHEKADAFKNFYERNKNAQAEGSKEPVAKETMPLLDMNNQEMDLRQEGGFVPIGRMEKADDVPARLSKNEFVFTADAVRNAGEGDIDKGAEVMYNMMKNLESGGEVSEESQGLDGAREMFQTSQRLEEVL